MAKFMPVPNDENFFNTVQFYMKFFSNWLGKDSEQNKNY